MSDAFTPTSTDARKLEREWIDRNKRIHNTLEGIYAPTYQLFGAIGHGTMGKQGTRMYEEHCCKGD